VKTNPFKDVAIVGVYNTEQARRIPGATSMDLAVEAIRSALEDAHLPPQELDGIAAFFDKRQPSFVP